MLEALDRLKGLKDERKKIWNNFVKCQEDKCLEFYSCWPEAFKDCMDDCLKTYYKEIKKNIWDPRDELCRKYRHIEVFKKYCY